MSLVAAPMSFALLGMGARVDGAVGDALKDLALSLQYRDQVLFHVPSSPRVARSRPFVLCSCTG